MTANRRILPAAVFVLLLATFLRFHSLAAQSFWNDEGNSARLSERSIPAILEGTASDIHPPLYYLMLRGWREWAGETEFGLRSLSTFAGVLTVAAVIALARGRGRRGEGEKGGGFVAGQLVVVAAGLLAALSPALVYYSQETRMYASLALIAALSAWVLLVWLGRGAGRRIGWAAAYALLLAAGLYTHYFFPAVITAQGAVVGLWWVAPQQAGRPESGRGRRVAVWVGLVAVAGALYGPWVPIFLRQIGGRADAPTALLDFAAESGRWLVLGGTVYPGEAAWAAIAAAALVILGVAAGRWRAAAPLLLALIPAALMAAVGATDPAFFKFLLAVVPFLVLLMGLAWRVRGWWLAAPAALTVMVVWGSFISLGNLYTDPAFARADYRGMAARIAADGGNTGIILDAPNQWEVFTYYHRDGAPVYPLPRGRPDPAVLEPELARIAATHDRLYTLYWGEGQRDPERVVERWLDAHTFKAAEEWVGDVRLAVYVVPREAPTGARPSGAAFGGRDGETITLHEFTVWPGTARPGEAIQARLVWSADATPARPYKVFLHLLDGAGRVVAQRDGEPAGGSRPTTGWAPGERIVDNYGMVLPGDLPPGEYALRLGLYDAFDPAARLPVSGGDSLPLGTVVVVGVE